MFRLSKYHVQAVFFILLVAAMVFFLPTVITLLMTDRGHNNIVWNKNAVFVNSTVISNEIVNYTFSEQCDPKCVGSCTSCIIRGYDAYTNLAYSTYVYRYLSHQGYRNRTALELALQQYQSNGTKIGLYYNPENPRQVYFHLLPEAVDIFICFNIAFLYLVATVGSITAGIKIWQGFMIHKALYDNIPEAPETKQESNEKDRLVVNDGRSGLF